MRVKVSRCLFKTLRLAFYVFWCPECVVARRHLHCFISKILIKTIFDRKMMMAKNLTIFFSTMEIYFKIFTVRERNFKPLAVKATTLLRPSEQRKWAAPYYGDHGFERCLVSNPKLLNKRHSSFV